MEILTIKDKNYNVGSMRDIFEILDSNGMNEISQYIRRYINWLLWQFDDINEDLREAVAYADEDDIREVCLQSHKTIKSIMANLDEVVS